MFVLSCVDSIVDGDEVEVSHCRLLKVLFTLLHCCSVVFAAKKTIDQFLFLLLFLYYIFLI